MLHRFHLAALCGLAGCVLNAQGIFTNANKPGDPTCPRVLQEKTELNYKSQYGRNGADPSHVLYTQQGDWLVAPGERKDVGPFTAYDEEGHGTSIASLRGKVVLVGLWSKNCDPSAKMLMEFSALYDKRTKFGFEILAVNFDENQQDGGRIEGGWRAIRKFMSRNRSFFESSKMPVFVPGLGKEGPSNFMDMVYSLPVLFVVDRQGKLAEIHIGYKDGFVGEAVKRALLDRSATAPPPPAPAPAPAAQ